LEEQAQALYKSWFIDFEPFKDGKFVDSELGLIPEEWQIKRFSDFTRLSNERVHDIDVPEFSVTNHGIFPRDSKFNKQLSSSPFKNKVIHQGDLVFGMSREILNWGIMKDPIGGVSSAYTVYNVDESTVNSLYLDYFIQNHTPYFKDLIKPAAREGQGVDKSILASKLILLPEQDVWARFLMLFNPILQARHHIQKELCCLEEYRDKLLPELLSGQIVC
jgi:hypothetical protein